MGAWGRGIFENDRALDFVIEIVEADDWSVIERTLEEIINTPNEDLDADLAQDGLVVAEIVAALHGYASELPEELADWIADKDALPDKTRRKTHDAVLKVFNDSELRELREDAEPEAFAEWRDAVQDLLRRLSV